MAAGDCVPWLFKKVINKVMVCELPALVVMVSFATTDVVHLLSLVNIPHLVHSPSVSDVGDTLDLQTRQLE